MPSEQRDAKFIHERAQYEYFYTLFFGLDGAKYNDKKILDIGCGPMGSSEWADQTSVRIGLDPLADEYCKLGTASHHMRYVAAVSEYIPFADESFDFVTSLNSLDHVVGVRQTVNEIKRVTAAHRIILISTEIEHDSTLTEPHRLRPSVTELFLPESTVKSLRLFGIRSHDNLYANLLDDTPYEDGNPGLLCARIRKC
jgi:2-polyprenyl-3-methyl-5-hydroxy-6-metoxy-1,4-benzoquinol methylase